MYIKYSYIISIKKKIKRKEKKKGTYQKDHFNILIFKTIKNPIL